MRMWVQSLALLSELRTQHCHELWRRSQMKLGSPVVVFFVFRMFVFCFFWLHLQHVEVPRLGVELKLQVLA